MHVVLISQPRDPINAEGGQHGSVAIVTAALAEQLGQRHQVTILAPAAPGQPPTERGPGGSRIERLPAGSRQLNKAREILGTFLGGSVPFQATKAYFAGYFEAVGRRLQEVKPAVVHLHNDFQQAPALAERLGAIPLVLHFHGEGPLRLPEKDVAEGLGAAAGIVTCSAWLSDRLAARFPSEAAKIATIGNGVDTERFTPAAEAPAGPPVLANIGRISPDKGVHVLTEAFARLAPEFPDLRLEISGPVGLLPAGTLAIMEPHPALQALEPFYGRGLVDQVRRQIVRAGKGYAEDIMAPIPAKLRDRVTLRGKIEHDRLPDLYRAATVFAMPSVILEPFGMPLVEAMACGLPVVTTESGGIPWILGSPPAGVMVERGDVDGLSTALASLLRDPRRRLTLGASARARTVEMFTWAAVSTRLEQVYARLAG
ncbi:MAG: glycosyltransferase family 4 protein [Geminicoccaceae bacterium]